MTDGIFTSVQSKARLPDARKGVTATGHIVEYLSLLIYGVQDTASRGVVLGFVAFVALFLAPVTYALYAGRTRLRRVWRH